MTARVFLTAPELAAIVGCDNKSIHTWVGRGVLRCFRTPGRHIRITPEDAVAFLRKYGIPVPQDLEMRMLELYFWGRIQGPECALWLPMGGHVIATEALPARVLARAFEAQKLEHVLGKPPAERDWTIVPVRVRSKLGASTEETGVFIASAYLSEQFLRQLAEAQFSRFLDVL